MAQSIHFICKSVDRNNFLLEYNNISVKLKKRFLRKPNVAEASDQFDNLGVECEQKELGPYAGMCWLSAARCQSTLRNVLSEINFLTNAGRQFLITHKKYDQIGCSLHQENLQAATNCFIHALTRCQCQDGFSMMSAGLAMELASASRSNGVQSIRIAIDIHPNLRAIKTLSAHYIEEGDYVAALEVLTELVEMIENNNTTGAIGNYAFILQRCEISRVLLLLILQPIPQRLTPSQALVLEKYAWVEESSNIGLKITVDEMLLLQSLVLACQSHDYQALLVLEGELWPYMDMQQKGLLNKLMQTLDKQ